MKKKELVYREILLYAMEKNIKILTQSKLAKDLNISLSTVNNALKPLRKMNAIKVKLRNFQIIDTKKILLYWASIRNLDKDITYKTRVEKPVREIEKEMPDDVAFTGYSAYKFSFKEVPADYSEVYVYGNSLEKRFPKNNKVPNLFVLKNNFKIVTLAQLFVDLWNLKEWYAKDFLKALEAKLNAILE